MRELLLVTFDGRRYGVWKDEVLSVNDVPAFHRIPLSPACVAGMAIIDDKTVMLADLGICIGYTQPVEAGHGRVLLLPGLEKSAGFIVNGEIDSLSVRPEAVFRMPAYLASSLIDTCMMLEKKPIPIINIASLYDRMLKTDEVPPGVSLEIPAALHEGGPVPERVRVITLGDERYAMSDEGLEHGSIVPGRIARLMNVPRYVRGVAQLNERILPVIDLSQRILRRAVRSSACMLVAEVGETVFGLLVDDEKRPEDLGDLIIKPLPLLAQSEWLRSAVLSEDQILPLVDLALLLSQRSDETEEAQPEQHYKPDSQFAASFLHGAVEVVEFSLLGVRHALPKTEVADVIDMKPYRTIPNAPQIVVGVAEHEGVLLSVLDLAFVFGRSSFVAPGWKMMLVKNGDFSALVVTEAVYGERHILPEQQRAVPIVLPHHVVYGCYPDADAVRLVLNVEAMASHFEKSLVQEFLPALSREMREAPSRIVHALLGEGEAEAQQPEESPEMVPQEPELIAAAAEPTGLAPMVPDEVAVEEQFNKTEDVQEVVPEDEEQVTEEATNTVTEAETSEIEVTSVKEPGPPSESVHEKTEELTKETSLSTEDTEAHREESEIREDEGVRDVQQEPVLEQLKNEPVQDEGIIDRPGHVEAETEPPIPEEPVHERGSEPISTASGPDREPVTTLMEQGSTQAAASAAPADVAETRELGEEQVEEAGTKESFTSVGATEGIPAPREQAPDRAWKRRLLTGAIGVVMVAGLYFAGTSHKPLVEEHLLPIKEATKAGKFGQTAVKARAAAPLLLEIPPTRHVDAEVYVVRKGDTLWGISKWFTGDPYKYPIIAGENKIADPDLIFPGQKIQFKKR